MTVLGNRKSRRDAPRIAALAGPSTSENECDHGGDRDTTGRWDELLVDQGVFAGFAPLGATSLADAIARIRGAR
jgi:hypothetical protein